VKVYSDEEIDAALERQGLHFLSPEVQQDSQEDRPAAQKGCICPNDHKPNTEGLIYTAPSCTLHGCRTRWPYSSQLNRTDRIAGSIHGRRNGDS
jgi:hypothetical protein